MALTTTAKQEQQDQLTHTECFLEASHWVKRFMLSHGFLIFIFTTNLQTDTIISNYDYLYFTDEETVAQRVLSNVGNVVTQ